MDTFDWIVSPENQDYLREQHVPTFEEKVHVVCGSCRSVEEKYAALTALTVESSSQDDTNLITDLLRLYEWFFSELRKDHPGQIFVFMEACDRSFDDVISVRFDGVEKLFQTTDGLQTYINDYAVLSHTQFKTANVEKWCMVDGERQSILDLHLCFDYGHAFIDRFDIPMKQYKTMDICFAAQISHTGDFRTTLPLPYQSGDIVRIDIPVLSDPVYGVLYIYEAYGRYMHLAYIEDNKLKTADMSYQDIGAFSGWRVIDWVHPVQVFELPLGQELLGELSEYARRKGLTDEEDQKLHRLFISRPRLLMNGQITLTSLLEEKDDDE